MADLIIQERHWLDLSSALDDHRETAFFVIAGIARTDDGLRLSSRSIVTLEKADYARREPTGLEVTSAAVMRAAKLAAFHAGALIFVHTHPGAAVASHSGIDLQLRDAMSLVARGRSGSNAFGTLVIAGAPNEVRTSALVEDESGRVTAGRVTIVGDRIAVDSSSAGGTSDPRPFDRQIRAFGQRGQALLGSVRAAVVGAGGTGSAVFEELVRLGVGDVIVVDPDELSLDNVSRVYGSAVPLVGQPKIDVASANALRIGLGTKVRSIRARINVESAARRLTARDVVFGCTDDNAGRMILSRLAYWYLIPVIDMAVVISSTHGAIDGVFGRVTTMVPGEPCLLCRERVDPQRARSEVISPTEYDSLRREGYVPALDEPAAALVPFTTTVAALAVNEYLGRLFGYGRPAGEVVVRFHDREIRRIAATPREGHFCAQPATWGRGDESPFLGITWT